MSTETKIARMVENFRGYAADAALGKAAADSILKMTQRIPDADLIALGDAGFMNALATLAHGAMAMGQVLAEAACALQDRQTKIIEQANPTKHNQSMLN